jgi:hypothetical protein
MPWDWISSIFATAVDFVVTVFTGVIATLVVDAAAIVLLYIRAIGQLTPTCGFTLELSSGLTNLLTEWIRFWWPILSWLPWMYTWYALGLWISYLVFKLIWQFAPRIIHWIITAIAGVIAFFKP